MHWSRLGAKQALSGGMRESAGCNRRARPGKGEKAHHGYTLGASHQVKRERRLWTNIGRCPLSVAHALRMAAMLSHPPRPYHMRMRGVKWGRMGYCLGVRCGMLTIRYKRNLSPKHIPFSLLRLRLRC